MKLQQIKHMLFCACISDKTIDARKLMEMSIDVAIASDCAPSKVAYDLITLALHFNAQKNEESKNGKK